ncbi:MAG: T9SS type A sorting domain-containing protein [Flavobacteriales bacterium]|nr:T9SS type A sorting domain-containing protein [Flavobacteriales bacterium]
MKKNLLLSLFAALLVVLVCPMWSVGQISITALPYNPPTTDFNGYNPTSLTTLNSTIPAGWSAASSGTAAYQGRTNSPGTAGGYYGFGTNPDFSLGAFRSGSPGNITYAVSFTNNSGSTITSLTLAWDYEQWKFQGNTSGFNCSGTGGLAGNATVDGKDFTGAGTGTAGAVTSVASFTLTGLSIANGATFGLSWLTTDLTGADNAVSIDNFSISAIAAVSEAITTGAVSTSPFCVSATGTTTGTVAFTSTGTFTGNTYTAQLSSAAGSFASPTAIGTLASNANSGTVNITIPANTATGAGYLIRVVADGPSTTGSSSSAFTINLGPANATGQAATSGANAQSSVSWTNPATCFDDIMIVAKATAFTAAVPSGNAYVHSSNSFTNGLNSIFDGGVVVYKGSASPQVITSLTNGTTYNFKIFSRKNDDWSAGVTATGTPSSTTITTGAVSTAPFCVSATSTTTGTVAFTSTGTFSGNTYTAQLSNSVGSFASPTAIGTLVSNANSGTINITIAANTATGAGYLIRVVADAPTTTGTNSSAFTINLGPANVTAQAATSGGNTVSSVSWTNPTTCYDDIMIVAKATAFTAAVPSGNAYVHNSNSFTDGVNSTFDGGKVVYKGSTSAQVITNLTNGTAYTFKIFSRKNNDWSAGVTATGTPANPTVSLIINTTTGTEAATTAIVLTATASSAVIGDQTVSIALSGTGLTNGDFTGVTFPATITILGGTSSRTLSFNIADDNAAEGAETATFTMNSTSGGISNGSPLTRNLAITDNPLTVIVLNALNTPATENFDGMAASGTAATPTGFAIHNESLSTLAGAVTQQASSGTPTSGGSYNWGQNGATDRGLGLMFSGGYNGYSVLAAVKNNTGSSGTLFEISFDYEQFRRNSSTQTFKLQYSTLLASGWVDVTGGDFGNMVDGANAYDFTTLIASESIASLQFAPVSPVPNGTTIYFRWILDGSSNSNGVGIDNFSVALITVSCTAPTTQANTIAFNTIGQTSMNVSWTSGDGTNRVVYVNSTNSFTAPTDGAVLPAANTTWASAGQQLIYNGNGSSSSVSNLAAGTTYYYRVYEYNCTGGNTKFNANTATQNPNSQATSVAASTASVIQTQNGEATTISSLVNGTIVSNANGVQVWRFRLYDGNGVSNDADGLPTIYKSWTITQGAGNTVPDWGAAIADRKFFLASDNSIISGGGLTNAANIPFAISSPYLTVADGGFVDVYMRITLANPLPSGSDGQKFAFKLVQTDVTVETSTTSSQLGTFTAVSDNTKNEIDILATLQFINAPASVTLGSNFSITVSAVDANGNIDVNNTSAITLSQFSGSGTLSGGATQNLVNGTFTFTGLSYDALGSFQVQATGGGFGAIYATINSTNNPFQLFDDFNRVNSNSVGVPSSETVTSYTEDESGDGTKTRIVSNELWIGNCNSNSSGGNEYMEQVMFNVENRHETVYDNAGSSMVWLFNMKQSRPNPSGFDGGNYASGVILGSDQLNVDAAGADGYAVILGNSNEDQIRLVRFTNGLTANSNTTVIVQTLDVDADNYFSIKVTYNPCDGAWTLSARDDGSAAFAAPNVGSLGTVFTGTDATPHTSLDLKYFGMIWNHQNSCGEIATFDNVNIPNASSATTSAKEWNGSISADWNVAGNWGPCPGVPTNLQNVIIPNVATQPIVMNATPATCKDLTVNAGADLTINATRFLNVWGNVLNNGAAAFGAGTLTMEGTGTLTLTGNVTVANYHVSTNVTLNGTVTISDIARSEVGGVLASNGNLVLLNGAQLLHGVGTPNGGGSVTGNIVVKRQGNSTTLFNAWATPVVGGALPGSNGYLYNSLSGTNSNLDDNVLVPDWGWAPHSGAMTAGVGYFSTNGGLATFTGVPNNGNYAPTVTGSNQGLSSQTAPSFFNLVGNPYPSAINANLFISQNSTPLDGALYFWNDQDNTFTSTDYATYTTAGGVPAAGSPLEEPNGSIPSCQGFFVNCRTGNDTPIALNFNNGQRGGNNSQFFRMAAPDYQRMWISINNTNLNLFNQTLVGFDEFATDQKDWGVDAYKFRGNQDISIGAQQDGETYVIATYETIPQSGKIVPLMTYVQTAGTYTFVADSMEGFENHTVYLEDLSNGSLYPLEQGDSYSFNMTSADEFNRFQLWFSPLTITGVDEVANDLRIYATNDMVVVENTSGESTKGTVQITDMAGRMVLTNDLTITNGIGRLQTANLANGIYAVSFVSMNGNQSIAQKVTLGQ